MPWLPQLCTSHERMHALPSQQLEHASRVHTFIAACGVGLAPFALCKGLVLQYSMCMQPAQLYAGAGEAYIDTRAAVLEPSYAT